MAEAALVQRQQALAAAQNQQRAFVASALKQAAALAEQRAALEAAAVPAALLHMHHVLHATGGAAVATATVGAPPASAPNVIAVEGAAETPAADASEARDLLQLMETAQRSAAAAAAQQAKQLETAMQDLFCSPEILRQGAMAHWHAPASEWRPCHYVLTRSHTLHWRTGADARSRPLESLALGSCQFEQGEVPVFSISKAPAGGRWTLGGGRGKKHTFQAGSVEECCEMAIAIREAIRAASCGGSSA